jgi:hypothetical protein
VSTPAKTVDLFQERVREIVDYYQELLLAVHGKVRESSLKSMLAEQTVMSMAVLWEGFTNDILLVHAAADSGAYFSGLKIRIRQNLLGGKFAGAVSSIRFSFPIGPTKERMSKIVDPSGWNISASNSDALAKRANELLAANRAKRFSLAIEDRAFIDYLVCLRNYLSHHSQKSRAELLASIAAMQVQAPNADLVGGVANKVGAYLKLPNSGGHTRTSIIGARLVEVSENLR